MRPRIALKTFFLLVLLVAILVQWRMNSIEPLRGPIFIVVDARSGQKETVASHALLDAISESAFGILDVEYRRKKTVSNSPQPSLRDVRKRVSAEFNSERGAFQLLISRSYFGEDPIATQIHDFACHALAYTKLKDYQLTILEEVEIE